VARRPGTKLSPYEILSPPVAGSAGEVSKEKDSRPKRTVAMDVLPSRLSSNADTRRLRSAAKRVAVESGQNRGRYRRTAALVRGD